MNTCERAMTRWYTAAYGTTKGDVVQIGGETLSLADAEREAQLIDQDADTEVFVAFKDEPHWQRLKP